MPFSNVTFLKNDFTQADVPFISSAFNYTLYPYVNHTNAILHLWTTTNQVALGPRDKQLPHYTSALNWLAKNGFEIYNRNAGGLAVVGDTDILNGSLIFEQPEKPLSIDAAYQLVVELLQATFPDLTLTVGEVPTSYCPGTYDISLGTQKIAGLAQHRYQNKIAVSFYLSVAGDQAKRCHLISQMYRIGLASDTITAPYPNIDANQMTTLAAHSAYTMAKVVNNITHNWFPMAKFDTTQLDDADLQHQIQRLQSRQSIPITALNN